MAKSREVGHKGSPTETASQKLLAFPFEMREIRVDRIRRYERQPREHFDPSELHNLRDSLATLGQGDPISVRILRGDPNYDYELIDGERRLLSAKAAGHKTIIAMVYDLEDESVQFMLAVLKNSGKAKHQPLEIASAINRFRAEKRSVNEIAHLLSIAVPTVHMYGRLINLPDEVKALMSPERRKGERLKVSAALEILELPLERQLELAKRCISGELSFRMLKHEVRRAASKQPRIVGSGSSMRSPNKDYAQFRSFLRVASEEASIWSACDQGDYRRILANREDRDRLGLIRQIEQLETNLKKIKEGLQKAFINGPRARARNAG